MTFRKCRTFSYYMIMVYFKIEFGRGRGPRRPDAPATKRRMETDGWTEVTAEVERMRAERRFKTAANYLTAARSWSRYLGLSSWRFSQMTAEGMERYQRWLCQQGLCHNTVSAYMRCLRAMYNRVTGDGQGKPFAKVFTGRERTCKRSVTADVMLRLHRLALSEGSALALARDLFVFGFQALGMPFVDMAYLKKSQVCGGVIHYDRHKTGQHILVPVTAEMARLMRRHASPTSEYVFPILTAQELEARHRQYRHALRHYNYLLHKLSAMVDARVQLSSYVVRHSWASIAYQHHIDIGLIGKALGHTKTSTTMVYIKSLFDKDLATANEALMCEIGLSEGSGATVGPQQPHPTGI